MNSKIKECSTIINDLIVIQPDSFYDHRGENFETYNEEHYSKMFRSISEFKNKDLEKHKEKIARELGYKLINSKLELYGVSIKK